MLCGKTVILRVVEEQDIEMIRQWRTSTEIRKNFGDTLPYSAIQQRKWFEKISVDNSQFFFIAEFNNRAFGVLNIQNIDMKNGIATIGWYFIDREVNSIHILQAVALLIDYAFDELNIRKLYSDVLETNTKALTFNKKIGFIIEGIRKKHIFHSGKYIDLILVGLFKDDYKNAILKFRNKVY